MKKQQTIKGKGKGRQSSKHLPQRSITNSSSFTLSDVVQVLDIFGLFTEETKSEKRQREMKKQIDDYNNRDKPSVFDCVYSIVNWPASFITN